MENGLVATDYIETGATTEQAGILEDMPRLDYSGGATCPSLLLEPQRSNLAVNSEYFGGWTTIGTATFTANYGESPEGVQNAYRFEATSAARGGKYVTISVSSGTTYTLSFYAKSLSGTQKIRIGADNGCAIPQGAETFEITTEWQRISTTITSTETQWNVFFDNIESGTACTGTYLDADLLVYGFQLEAGSYSTSLIPTYGSSVTRSADSCSKTGISSLIGQTEGVVFWDIQVDILSATGHEDILNIDDGSFGNTLYFIKGSTGILTAEIYASSTSQCTFSHSLSSVGRYKMALAYANNDFVFYVNGVQIGTDTSGSVPTMSRFQIGNGVFGASTGKTNQTILFPTRLTNDELASLTTI